eukprot:CAMPEP_0116840684 /NCGR_PEP_ID=MMETSP0418-20121206/10500_1 /TAXON_ID=1158023 /ORGANISM="Astrosyne radiata, Strain 13vi08-1A" /LENGTH=379 /DNA_ID=CAMNT_0004471015 /DNA_START=358 /DNA_END=1497 /DNA_ORIENTATION=+
MSRVQVLEFGYNFLSGSVPTELGNCISLTSLGVTRNEGLSGQLDSILDGFPSTLMRILYAGRTGIGGIIPTTVGRFSSLEILTLGDNQEVTGTLPSEMGLMTKLTWLDLGNNKVRGTVPTDIGRLRGLRDFDLSFNQFNGTIPTELGNLRSLERLDLGHNYLSGPAVPTELGNCHGLLAFGVFGNTGLYGRMESILHILPTGLGIFFAGQTGIGGSIPTTIGGFTALQYLNLDQNHQVTGTLPSEMGLLSNLIRANFRSNQLWGTLPTEMGLLGAATSLQFGGNNFTGTLAPEFAGWTSLEILNVSQNVLSGSPSVLKELPALHTLLMYGNRFHDLGGLCDDAWFRWNSFVANSCTVSNRYDCSCCTACCNANGSCVRQ